MLIYKIFFCPVKKKSKAFIKRNIDLSKTSYILILTTVSVYKANFSLENFVGDK